MWVNCSNNEKHDVRHLKIEPVKHSLRNWVGCKFADEYNVITKLKLVSYTHPVTDRTASFTVFAVDTHPVGLYEVLINSPMKVFLIPLDEGQKNNGIL